MDMPLSFIALHTVLMLAPCIMLCIIPFRKRMRLPFSCICMFAFVLVTGLTALTVFVFSQKNPAYWLVPFSVFILLLLAVLCVTLLRAPVWQLLFTLFVLENYCDVVTLLSRWMETDFLNPLFNFSIYACAAIARMCMTLMTVPLMWYFMKHILLPSIEENEVQPYWRYLWLIPFTSFLIFRLGIYPNHLQQFLQQTTLRPALPIIWTVSTFGCYAVVLILLRKTAENTRLHEQLELSEIRLALQREQYQQLQHTVCETRRMRHDLRHQLLALDGYVHAHDYDGLSDYLQSALRAADHPDGAPICANAALDAIIRHYTERARRAGAKITCSISLPETLAFPDNDLCILLGNLLENAAEAIERQTDQKRFLELKLGISGRDMLTILVRNSYSGEVTERCGTFRSMKHSGNGIGIVSVRAIADKYHAITKIEYADHVFTASLLLKP